MECVQPLSPLVAMRSDISLSTGLFGDTSRLYFLTKTLQVVCVSREQFETREVYLDLPSSARNEKRHVKKVLSSHNPGGPPGFPT